MADIDEIIREGEEEARRAQREIDEIIRKGEEDARRAGRDKIALETMLARQQADDRSSIAKQIVGVFVILIALTIIAVVISNWALGWEGIADAGKFVADLLSGVMLPVVTLVIGYYFGSK